jgi:serine/threonine protein kinase
MELPAVARGFAALSAKLTLHLTGKILMGDEEKVVGDLPSIDSGSFSDEGGPDDGEPTRREIGVGVQPSAAPAVLSGRMVSHFRIGEPLGSGGMGVVYGAEDIQLGRSVALKFLAPELVRDPQAKARFLTEARAASALDHPNLCTILEVGESDEGLLFLAMPRYEGESLDHRLSRGAVPVEEAIDIASQIAQGLAKAHRHGIVHRDIKPGNLLLTDDGLVKILDFGIAKLLGVAGPTLLGSFLGTPSYMAPEQTRGEPVDARADVWSLGVVLYEMLAGKRPFIGGTAAAVVHAVLYEEPESLARLCPEVPQELVQIVNRMLARDPSVRYATAAEALADMRAALDLPTTGSRTLPSAGRPGRRALLPVILTLGLVAAGGVMGLLLWRKGKDTPALQPANFTRLTDLPGKETSPSVSPDGAFFVYAKSEGGNSDLFLQRVAGDNPMNLTASSPSDDIQPAFSPDGQQIAFRSERDGGGIFVMGAMGGSVRRLTDFGFNPTWSPDGREIAVATEGAFDPGSRMSRSQIFRVDVNGSSRAPRSLGVQDGVQPSWSPHGWRIAFWGLVQPGARRAIWTIPVGGGSPVTVVDDSFYNWSPAWSPDGKFLYFASNRGGSMNLWRVAIDERSGKVTGNPQPITTPAEWSALPSFSHDGHLLLYATNDSRSFVEQVPLDPKNGRSSGPPVPVFQAARSIGGCDISPDGKWIVLEAESPQEDLLLIRPDGKEIRQLTNDPAHDRSPRWSPDGNRILFSSNRSGKYEAWTIRPDGSGLTQVTNLPEQAVFDPFWSPDGKKIGFTYGARGTGILDLVGTPSSLRVLPPVDSGLVFAGLSWSEDGRFLTGMLLRQDESPVPGLSLWSLAHNAHRRLKQAGHSPEFFHNAKRILFTEGGSILALDLANGELWTLATPPLNTSYVSESVGPHDRSMCTVRATNEGDIWSLSLVDSAAPY